MLDNGGLSHLHSLVLVLVDDSNLLLQGQLEKLNALEEPPSGCSKPMYRIGNARHSEREGKPRQEELEEMTRRNETT